MIEQGATAGTQVASITVVFYMLTHHKGMTSSYNTMMYQIKSG